MSEGLIVAFIVALVVVWRIGKIEDATLTLARGRAAEAMNAYKLYDLYQVVSRLRAQGKTDTDYYREVVDEILCVHAVIADAYDHRGGTKNQDAVYRDIDARQNA